MKRPLGVLALATVAVAQASTISVGTSIAVRTNEAIDARKSDGRVFAGVVNQDGWMQTATLPSPEGRTPS